MPILHKNINNSADIHNPKWFEDADNGNLAWKNEKGELENTDELVLPAALEFVDASVAPPTTNTGDIYVLSSGGSVEAGWGAVALKDWVRYDGTDWNKITPQKSTLCYNETDDTLYSYDGALWSQIGGVSIYTDSGIVPTSVVATLTDVLSFDGGEVRFYGKDTLQANSAVSIWDNDTTPKKLWDFRNDGEIIPRLNDGIRIGSGNVWTAYGQKGVYLGHENNINAGFAVNVIGRDNSIQAGVSDVNVLGLANITNAGLNTMIGQLNINEQLYTYAAGISIKNTAVGAMTIGKGVNISYVNPLVNNTPYSLALGWNTTTPQHLFTSTYAVLNGNTKVGSEVNSFQGGETLIQGADTLSTSTALSIYDNDTTPSLLFDVRNNGDIGLFGGTAAGQQSTTGTVAGFTAGVGTGVNADSTFTGGTGVTAYTISDVVLALKNLNILQA